MGRRELAASRKFLSINQFRDSLSQTTSVTSFWQQFWAWSTQRSRWHYYVGRVTGLHHNIDRSAVKSSSKFYFLFLWPFTDFYLKNHDKFRPKFLLNCYPTSSSTVSSRVIENVKRFLFIWKARCRLPTCIVWGQNGRKQLASIITGIQE